MSRTLAHHPLRTAACIALAALLPALTLPQAARTETEGPRPAPASPPTTAPAPGLLARPKAASAWVGLQLGVVREPAGMTVGVPPTTGPDAPVPPSPKLMVLAVVKDSPAEKAGLEPFDLITGVDQQAVAGDLAAFTAYVQGRKAGDTMRLTIARQEQTKELAVILAAPPPGFGTPGSVGPKHAQQSTPRLEPGAIYVPRGNTLEKLDPAAAANIPIMAQMPEELRLKLFARLSDQLAPPVAIKAKRVLEDKTVQVEQDPQGRFTVTVWPGQGEPPLKGETKSQVTHYATAEAMQKADRDAYGVYQDALAIRGTPGGGASTAVGTPGGAGATTQPLNAPSEYYRFHRLADGQLEVEVHQSGTLGIWTFQTEDDFRKELPKVYEKYQSLRNGN